MSKSLQVCITQGGGGPDLAQCGPPPYAILHPLSQRTKRGPLDTKVKLVNDNSRKLHRFTFRDLITIRTKRFSQLSFFADAAC